MCSIKTLLHRGNPAQAVEPERFTEIIPTDVRNCYQPSENASNFVERVRKGEEFISLDIRTPGETHFFTSNMPGHLSIPLSELFEHENLAKLPEQGNIVILCKSGTRATAAATALRSIGFKQTYVLKGGFKGLSAYMGPKEANGPMQTKTAAK